MSTAPTMSRNAADDFLVQAFVSTQSIFLLAVCAGAWATRAARARCDSLAGARFVGRFAGVRLGGGLRPPAHHQLSSWGHRGSNLRGNQSMFGIDRLVVGIGPQRPDPGPRAGDARFAGLRGLARGEGAP